MGTDKQEAIRHRAFDIWDAEGRPEGADLRHWLQAEDELSGDDEHETMQELIDRDDAEYLETDEVEITTGVEAGSAKKTEGP